MAILPYKIRAFLGRDYDQMTECHVFARAGEAPRITYWNPRLGKQPTQDQLDALDVAAEAIHQSVVNQKTERQEIQELKARLSLLEGRG